MAPRSIRRPVSAADEYIQSLARGLSVIKTFGDDAPSLTLSEVAARVDLSRATARRILWTLHRLGYVRTDGRTFALAVRTLDLGYAYLSSMNLWEAAQPYMEEVAEQVRESCSASVLDDTEIVYVARVPTHRIMSITLGIGTRLPAHATSMGRVLLAGLLPADLHAWIRRAKLERLTERTVVNPKRLLHIVETSRRRGFATVDQELEQGLRSIAVPVHDASGAVAAAVNVSAHASRVSNAALVRKFLPHLQRAAEGIETAIALRQGTVALGRSRRH
jgi:IclR family transcriptional regulator, pca regulon regulatory protein